ncbi:MAG TPA: SAM-dependent methyltransferase [Pseudonocardiaceae bacterium]|nr:SAM-dependent methyltransferase [Pseudonocardiaceae bacterium]
MRGLQLFGIRLVDISREGDRMKLPSWASDDVDIEHASPARVYDYYLGGSHNFAVDRQMARQAIELWPDLPLVMQANRAFLRRSVRYLVKQGITQFLDIGSGIPTEGNVHEVAQVACPECRVVYVDIDPVAVAHSRAMLAGNPFADIVQADLRDVAAIFDDSRVRRLLDLSQPLGVLMVAMLHFVTNEADPANVVAQYRKMMPPGSYLAVSHATHEGRPEVAGPHTELYRRAGAPLTMRSRREIETILDGFELVEPGVVFMPLWRPDSPADVDDHPERFTGYAVVGRRP